MPKLHVQLFGEFRLRCNGEPVSGLNSPRTQALVAYLVLHRAAPQPRPHVAYQLWPDTAEKQARANLRYQLHLLRRAVPDLQNWLYADDVVLQWHTNIETSDVAAFEDAVAEASAAARAADRQRQRAALERAAGQYRGELLPSCYDDWILPERERLRAGYTAALEGLVQLAATEGDEPLAIRMAQQLQRHDPLHESTYRRLIELHAAAGDRVSALRAYHACVAVLQQELGIEPSAPTREAYRRVFKQTEPAEPGAPRSQASALPIVHVSDAPPNNVPLRLSSFIGRQRELRHVRALLARTRILTLTGPGGSGKTRLALEVAAESLLAGEYADGVWWVGLESLADGSLVLQSIAAALGLREQGSRPLEQIVSEHMRAKQMLLLLDNCEHLLRACESVVERLLGIAPHLRVMATSREPLGIAGEVIWPVPPLSLETQREPADAGVAYFSLAGQSEAVRLFVERAAESLPTFTWTDKNAKVISEICARLEGIPLALELAAARVRVLTLKQIAERLDASLGLLVRGSRNAPVPRHRTLRAAIDWSYNLLEQPERILFRRLSVFAGGFTLAAAEQTCGVSQVETNEVLDLLSRLVDKSLVTADLLQHGEARYRLLETIRQYAREQLVETGESDTLRQRHAQFFLTLAEVAEPQFLGPEQSYWLNRFEQEQDNLRAALDWAAHEDGDALGLRLAGALWRYWISRDHFQEGRAWLSRFLAREAAVIDKPARAKALLGATALAVPQGDYESARALGEESLRLYRELRDPRGIGLCLFALAIVAAERGDEAGACALLEDSLELWRELGDQRGIATALYNLGERARYRQDYRRAAELYEECLEIYDRTHDVGGQALAKRNLALVAQHENDSALAARLCAESLALWQGLGNKTQMSLCLDAFASVISARGDFERAACLMAAAKALRDEMGLALEKVDRVELERIMSRVRAALDEKTFAQAWAQGRAMTLEQAVESVSKES